MTEDKGKNTPGVDKVIWKTPGKDHRDCVVEETGLFGSSASEGNDTEEERENEATRHTRDARCRAMQALHLLALEPVAETTADPNSYGFRPERSTADAGEQCFIALGRKTSAQWVLEADIKACYDEISHPWMVANIPTGKVILQKCLKAGYVYQDELFPTDAGVPQGELFHR